MIVELIHHLVPDAQFRVVGEPSTAEEYANQVDWYDSQPQPTWDELEAARPGFVTASANKLAEEARADAYRIEADTLFFGYQRGENTEQEWLDKVAEIRARHPYA